MAQRLKKALPFLISSNQSTYVDNNLLAKVVHILKISDNTIDIQKAFDYFDQLFLICNSISISISNSISISSYSSMIREI